MLSALKIASLCLLFTLTSAHLCDDTCQHRMLFLCRNCPNTTYLNMEDTVTELNNGGLDLCWDKQNDVTNSAEIMLTKLANQNYDLLVVFNTLSGPIWSSSLSGQVRGQNWDGLNMVVFDPYARRGSNIPDVNWYIKHGVEDPDKLVSLNLNYFKHGIAGTIDSWEGPPRTSYGYIDTLGDFSKSHPEYQSLMIRDTTGNDVLIEYKINKGKIIYGTIPAYWFYGSPNPVPSELNTIVSNSIEVALLDPPSCVLLYSHLFVHNAHGYKSYFYNNRCHSINDGEGFHVPVLPRIYMPLYLFKNNDCVGFNTKISLCEWHDFYQMTNEIGARYFGLCDVVGTTAHWTNLPSEATHIHCEGWQESLPIGKDGTVSTPIPSGECAICNDESCDWTHYLYSLGRNYHNGQHICS